MLFRSGSARRAILRGLAGGSIRHIRDGVSVPTEHFTVHDLRRTLSTLWDENLDIDDSIVDRACGRAPKTINGKHYNKAKKLDRIFDAYTRWAAFIEAEVSKATGTNVTSLAAARSNATKAS